MAQYTDTPVLEAPPLLLAYVHLRGVWLRHPRVTLYIQNALLLELEQSNSYVLVVLRMGRS